MIVVHRSVFIMDYSEINFKRRLINTKENTKGIPASCYDGRMPYEVIINNDTDQPLFYYLNSNRTTAHALAEFCKINLSHTIKSPYDKNYKEFTITKVFIQLALEKPTIGRVRLEMFYDK